MGRGLCPCPKSSAPLWAALGAMVAPYLASQITLALGFEPFSSPTLPPQLGTGSSYTKAQKGSWGSQHAGEPLAVLPPAARYLASGGCVPQIRQSPPLSSCPLTLSQQLFPRTRQHFQLGREHFIQLRLADSLNGEM